MDVLSNGLKQNFWLPIEEHPDIDRFIDEDITVTVDNFKVRGVLLKVATCKKKDSNGDFEYFKQLTIEVNTISCGDQAFRIPMKKEEFQHDIDFHYVDQPEEVEEVTEPVEEVAAPVEEAEESQQVLSGTVEEVTEPVEEVTDTVEEVTETEPDITDDDIDAMFDEPDESTESKTPEKVEIPDDDEFDFGENDEPDFGEVGEKPVSVTTPGLDTDDETENLLDEEDEFDKMFEDETAGDAELVDENAGDPDDLEPDKKADKESGSDDDLDDDGIDWGD